MVKLLFSNVVFTIATPSVWIQYFLKSNLCLWHQKFLQAAGILDVNLLCISIDQYFGNKTVHPVYIRSYCLPFPDTSVPFALLRLYST